jgi:hypothetical protein
VIWPPTILDVLPIVGYIAGCALGPAQGQSIIALLAATTRCARGFISSAYLRLSRGQGPQRGCGETSHLATEGDLQLLHPFAFDPRGIATWVDARYEKIKESM